MSPSSAATGVTASRQNVTTPRRKGEEGEEGEEGGGGGGGGEEEGTLKKSTEFYHLTTYLSIHPLSCKMRSRHCTPQLCMWIHPIGPLQAEQENQTCVMITHASINYCYNGYAILCASSWWTSMFLTSGLDLLKTDDISLEVI